MLCGLLNRQVGYPAARICEDLAVCGPEYESRIGAVGDIDEFLGRVW